MTDELRERLNAVRAASAFASSEDVQWLVDRVEEAEARAADLADRELTALRTMEKAIKELADRDVKLAAVEALHRPYDCTAVGEPEHETCGEREWCYTCPEEMGWPCTTYQALSLSVPTSPTQAEEACETCAVSGEHELWCPNAPLSATMGELREALTAAIDLADVHESKSVGLYVEGEPVKPLTILGTRFMRGQFAFLLSVPTSRTCSAGIGGGETCDLPDGHEGPHSSDGIPVPTSPQMCEHSGPSLARRAIDGLVASPVDRCEQCGDDRAISAGPNCTEPNDHYPSEDTYTDEQIGRLVKAIDLPNDERNQRLEQDDFWADPPSTSPEQDKQR